MANHTTEIGVVRGAALYIGALLGPGLLLLPGLAVARAGPASVIAWGGLLGVSALFAVVFAALGVRHPGASGVRGYAEAGLGPRAGSAVAWCFLAGVVTGAPIVCVIGGNYVAELTGGGRQVAAATAGVLLLATIVVARRGVRTSATVQFGLVVLLLVIVVGGVAGAAPDSDSANWRPFAPHGWVAIGSAAASLMLAFVGWEAIAPLTGRFARPRTQLPVVIGIAFATTAAVYLALSVVTVAALGPAAATDVPLAALLQRAIGSSGTVVAAVGALVLTGGTVVAYLSGAAALVARGAAPRLFVTIAGAGVGSIGLMSAGALPLATLVNVPTAFFLVVYLICMAAAWRLLRGPVRAAAAAGGAVVVIVLAFIGYALLPALCVTAAALAWDRTSRTRRMRGLPTCGMSGSRRLSSGP